MSYIRLVENTRNSIINNISGVPYGVKYIGAPVLWKKGYTGKNVVIAVVDTGCDYNHPDLKENVIGGYNFTEGSSCDSNDFYDDNGHGTHVCGIIAARPHKNGVFGVAPDSKLLILKALSRTGHGEYLSLIKAIEYAISWRGKDGEKVSILSMSLGLCNNIPEVHSIIKKAVSNNILIACAAGNDGDGIGNTIEFKYPAIYPEVIQVGGVDINRNISSFSNTNYRLDIVAPAENILSTYPSNSYATLSGTSMATPHIAGAIALLINKFKSIYEREPLYHEILKILYMNTTSITKNKLEEGNGLINLTLGKI